jgi:hypothetical protein
MDGGVAVKDIYFTKCVSTPLSTYVAIKHIHAHIHLYKYLPHVPMILLLPIEGTREARD